MKLTEVVYLNLERHADRNKQMQEWLSAADVHPGRITRIEGIDAAFYESREAIIKAAVNDGFPEFRHILKEPVWFGRGDIACGWALRRIFRSISVRPSDQAVLVLLDDAELMRPFKEYVSVVVKAPDFDILQFAPWIPTDDRFKDLISRAPTPTSCAFDDRFVHGMLYPGEHASVYSPSGAAKMLDALSRKGNVHVFPEGVNELLGHGSIWRLISLRDPHDVWARCHNEFSYRDEQND